MKLIIPTCNRYMRFVEANIFALNFYWPEHPDIIILGYDRPEFDLPDRTEFYSIGTNDSIWNWSNDIKKFLSNEYHNDYLILHLDDFVVTQKVDDKKIIEFQKSIIKNNIDKGFLGLSYGFNVSELDNFSKLDEFLIYPADSRYRSSLNTAFWKKDYLISKLVDDISPWQFESQDNGGANDGATILLTKLPLLVYGDFMWQGKSEKSSWYSDVLSQGHIVEDGFVEKINNILHK